MIHKVYIYTHSIYIHIVYIYTHNIYIHVHIYTGTFEVLHLGPGTTPVQGRTAVRNMEAEAILPRAQLI